MDVVDIIECYFFVPAIVNPFFQILQFRAESTSNLQKQEADFLLELLAFQEIKLPCKMANLIFLGLS